VSLASRKFLKSACERCCGVEQLEVHHIDRNWKNNSPGNLQTLCRACHRAKHRKHPDGLRHNVSCSGMTQQLVEAIDEWRRQQRDIPNRSEAIRRLIDQAIGPDTKSPARSRGRRLPPGSES
jgi:HNH endonuclease